MNKLKHGLDRIPVDIKASLLLASVIFIFWIIMEYANDRATYEYLLQFTGWNPGSHYSSMVFFIPLFGVNIILDDNNANRYILIIRGYLIIMLSLRINYGIQDGMLFTPELLTTDNPYLRTSPYRPIYTILLPSIWLILVGFKTFMDYLRNRKQLLAR
ncbi:hypothetical protein [Carboxylicivirga marina]|uniref:Uncharacterized protein n=1 Tax=Carboxylicivirga marina TaxID=2800988 RepID=A0ABS1HE63_9BACT|nr:hypothetical protein [Carboxylicivirga marina]MBK3515961.1 hypothetical protein [Carboxylicivirga marina]